MRIKINIILLFLVAINANLVCMHNFEIYHVVHSYKPNYMRSKVNPHFELHLKWIRIMPVVYSVFGDFYPNIPGYEICLMGLGMSHGFLWVLDCNGDYLDFVSLYKLLGINYTLFPKIKVSSGFNYKTNDHDILIFTFRIYRERSNFAILDFYNHTFRNFTIRESEHPSFFRIFVEKPIPKIIFRDECYLSPEGKKLQIRVISVFPNGTVDFKIELNRTIETKQKIISWFCEPLLATDLNGDRNKECILISELEVKNPWDYFISVHIFNLTGKVIAEGMWRISHVTCRWGITKIRAFVGNIDGDGDHEIFIYVWSEKLEQSTLFMLDYEKGKIIFKPLIFFFYIVEPLLVQGPIIPVDLNGDGITEIILANATSIFAMNQ